MRFLASLLIVVASGVLYGLCFPPARLHWLAWVVLVPSFVIIGRAHRRGAMALAAVLATAGTVATVDWLPQTITVFFHQPWPLGIALLVAVAMIMVVPPYVFAALCYHRFAAAPRWWLAFATAAAWVVGEYARAHLWTGNPWVLFGYSQASVGPVVQLADLASVYGISFTLIVVNVALAQLWQAYRRERHAAGAALRGIAVALGLVLLVAGYGLARRSQIDAEHNDQSPPVTVGIIQGNLEIGSQWKQELYGKNLERYLALTLTALQEGHARLVVWPENAMTFFIEHEPLYQTAIGSFLQPWNAELLAGGVHYIDARQPRFFNAAFAIAPDGHVTARYDKQRLLPFSEYFPLPQVDFLRRDFGRVREFTAGGPAQPLPTLAGAAGVLICNEAFFPEIARERVHAGATYLVNLTNDTWVASEKFSLIAFDMSLVRAVEQRRYLVRASTAGPSAIIDPAGRVIVQTPLFTTTQCAGSVQARTGQTIYARVGDLFVVGCAALLTLTLALTVRRTAHS